LPTGVTGIILPYSDSIKRWGFFTDRPERVHEPRVGLGDCLSWAGGSTVTGDCEDSLVVVMIGVGVFVAFGDVGALGGLGCAGFGTWIGAGGSRLSAGDSSSIDGVW
jgi:hypothetical protein